MKTKTEIQDKIPPQARELEEAVLGAIMLEKAAFDTVVEILKPECFYLESHQRIYRAMQSLAQKSQPIDMLTIVEELKFREELEISGGPYYITRLTNAVVSAANIEAHSRIILQKYLLRQLIEIGREVVNDAYSERVDVFEVIGRHDKKFTGLTISNIKHGYTSIDLDIAKAVNKISTLRKTPGHLTGIPSGFTDLDRITHGWQPTDLIILAARPGVGKTSLALNLARNAAKAGTPVGLFSLEMSGQQLTDRHISAESGIFLTSLRNGHIDDQQMKTIESAAARIASLKIYTDDAGALNIFDLRSRARNMKRKHNVGLIILDYLQLMSGDGEGRNSNREQEISRISRDLKALAKELQVPIIALSQLSREIEKRSGKIPQLSDLRESGAIEQDADLVIFISRSDNGDPTSETRPGETSLIIGKHRNGILCTVKLNAQLHIQKFTDFKNEYATSPVNRWKPVSEMETTEDDNPF